MLYRSRTAPSSYQLPDFPHITSRRRQSCLGELYSFCDLQPSLHNAPPTAYITALVFRHVLRRHHHQCCATVRSLVAAAPQPAALLHGKPSPDAVNRREAVLCKDGLRIGSEEGGERDKVGRDYRLIGRLGDGGVGDAIGTGGRSLFDEGKKETARIVVLGQHPSAALQLELARCGRPPGEGPKVSLRTVSLGVGARFQTKRINGTRSGAQCPESTPVSTFHPSTCMPPAQLFWPSSLTPIFVHLRSRHSRFLLKHEDKSTLYNAPT